MKFGKNNNKFSRKSQFITGLFSLFLFFCCFTYLLPTPSDKNPKTGSVPAADVEFLLTHGYETAVATLSTVSPSIPETATLFPTEILPTFTLEPTETAFILPTQTVGSAAGLPACIHNQPQPAVVVDVVDGDTIKVLLDDGLVYSIRYIGVDTPESTIQHEYFGKEASQKNLELVGGKKVTMYKDVSETDKYGRLLRYIFVEDTFINYELVRQGFANAKRYTPDTACAELFEQGEGYAREQKLGFWSTVVQVPLSTEPGASSGGSSSGSLVIVTVNKSAEYVDIKNGSSSSVDLTGWNLLSEKGSQSCQLGGVIQSGAILRIYAASGSDGFNCNYSKNIWNNSEPDPAVLYNPQGAEVSRFP